MQLWINAFYIAVGYVNYYTYRVLYDIKKHQYLHNCSYIIIYIDISICRLQTRDREIKFRLYFVVLHNRYYYKYIKIVYWIIIFFNSLG